MKNHILALFKPLTLSVIALAIFALGQGAARADIVQYRTEGCFGAGCTPAGMSTAFGSGTVQLAFTGQPLTTLDTATPSGFTIGELGQFNLTGTGTFAATPFTLRVIQTMPTAGNASFVGTLTGTVISGGMGSDVRIIFNNTTITIGPVTYLLRNLTDGTTLFLDAPASGGITRPSAQITSAVIPEPATMILLGTGLAGVAAGVRRRRNAVKE